MTVADHAPNPQHPALRLEVVGIWLKAAGLLLLFALLMWIATW